MPSEVGVVFFKFDSIGVIFFILPRVVTRRRSPELSRLRTLQCYQNPRAFICHTSLSYFCDDQSKPSSIRTACQYIKGIRIASSQSQSSALHKADDYFPELVYNHCMNAIDAKNWNFCLYESLDLKSFIALNAVFVPPDGVKFLYCVTVSEGDRKEIFQKDFEIVEDACRFINGRYSHWKLTNLEDVSHHKGCSSCQAH